MIGKPINRRPIMYNVKINPITNGYLFSSDVYPDMGCVEMMIAASVTECQRMSVLPYARQLESAGGRQWKISGSIIFNVDYQG